MSKKSFSFRLSWKIIILTSGLFIIALACIAVRGTRMTKKNAANYVAATTKKAVADMDSFLNVCESTCMTMGLTIEEFQHSKVKLDTANFFDLMEKALERTDHILGFGVYYEPEAFSPKNRYAGVYVSCNRETMAMNHEWQDDLQNEIDGWDYFSADWYVRAREKGEGIWQKPFIDHLETGEDVFMTTFSYPMKDDEGNCFGVCSVDVALDWLKDKLLSLNPYENSNIIIFDDDRNVICNPISVTPFEGSLLDTPLIKGNESITFSVSNGAENWEWNKYKDVLTIDIRQGDSWAFCVAKTMDNGWHIMISNLYKEAFADLLHMWLAITFIAVLGLLILYFFCRKVVSDEAKPLVSFANAASKITAGKFDIPIPEVHTHDEIEDLGHALTYMQSEVTDYIEELRKTTSEKERLAGELDVARKIQMEMLCTRFPNSDKAEIFAGSIPAKEVGGDLYDFYISGKYVYFIIGDVSGKGIPAALLMAISISAFRATIRDNRPMTGIVSLINDTFCSSNEDMMFVTLVAGRIDTETYEMDVCNAGHNPMVYIKSDGHAEFVRLKTNIVCGVMPGFRYEADKVKLERDSRLVMYTDGITEAEDGIKAQYGEERLIRWASSNGPSDVADDRTAVKNLMNDVHAFTNGAEQNDDMTIMSITLHEKVTCA